MELREWYYLDETLKSDKESTRDSSSKNLQRGPVPASVLFKLFEKGIGLHPNSLIWKPGMNNWECISQVEPFVKMVNFFSKKWYYINLDGTQMGPIATRLLIHKLKKGDIDGLTLIYEKSLDGWKKVSEVDELREEMIKLSVEEEQAEAVINGTDANLSQLPYMNDEDEDIQNKIQDYFSSKKIEENEATNEGEFVQNKKSFVADNGVRYKWDIDENEWIEDESEEEDEKNLQEQEHDHFHNSRKRPSQIDEEVDFEAENAPETEKETSGKESEKSQKKRKKRKKKQPKTWVYVSGLPKNVTFDEIKDHFSKVGLIALSPYDQQPRIKIYYEKETGEAKGDCLICYNSEDSVTLATDILDGGYIRPTHQISVKVADFKAFGPTGGSGGSEGHNNSKHISQAQIKVAKNAAKQALAWNEDDDIGVSRSSALRIIVLESMFAPSDFDQESFAEELEKDIVSECEKFGHVEKLTVFSKNPKGIAVVKFATSFAAQECIKAMNGRYFGGRKIKSYFWDGVTNYSIVNAKQQLEEEQKEEERLEEFGDMLDREQEDLPEEFRLMTE